MLLAPVALTLGPSSAMGAPSPNVDPALCAPKQNSFTLDINNSFFPLPLEQQWVLAGNDHGQPVGLQVTVLNETESFFKGSRTVTTRVVEELEWEDANRNQVFDPGESLIEVARNYFAQTQDGTVCYFGEDVDIYDNGVVVSHEGAWRADARGNFVGVFMPAAPQVGMTFQQEGAPGVAEDQATITGTGTAKLPDGTRRDTIELSEFNPLDGGTSIKVYARGVGIIRDDIFRLVRTSQ
jgi:hypothetical protein